MNYKIILASSSPRRSGLLCSLGVDFSCVVPDISEDKSIFVKEPEKTVQTLAYKKASAVIDMLYSDTEIVKSKQLNKTVVSDKELSKDYIVISADTIVYHDDEILGKPRNKEEARHMLLSLSGKSHEVYTGICICTKEKSIQDFERTKVYFRELSEDEIERYLLSNEPYDKAGSYGIQERGALFVKKIQGDYFNVVGLPLCRIFEILRDEFEYLL